MDEMRVTVRAARSKPREVILKNKERMTVNIPIQLGFGDMPILDVTQGIEITRGDGNNLTILVWPDDLLPTIMRWMADLVEWIEQHAKEKS
jgi:hypothetical protein